MLTALFIIGVLLFIALVALFNSMQEEIERLRYKNELLVYYNKKMRDALRRKNNEEL